MNHLASVSSLLRGQGHLRGVLCVLAAFISLAFSAHAQWISSHRVGDTAYFLFSSPPRVERYDLAARGWLSAVQLPSTYGLPTCGWVDQDGIYVTYGRKSVCRHDLSGGSTVLLLQSAVNVSDLLTDGNWLFANQSDTYHARFASIDKTTGAVIGNFDHYADAIHGASIAPSVKKIFGRSNAVSGSINFVSYDDKGVVLASGGAPLDRNSPASWKTWVFPSGTRVVDSSGTLYSGTTLKYMGSLGTRVDDIQFPDDSGPIVLRQNLVTAYTSSLLPAGSASLSFIATSFYLQGADAVAFGAASGRPNGIWVGIVPLSAIRPPSEQTGKDPANLDYVPNDVLVTNDGTVLLVSRIHKSVFRWSIESQSYLATIPLSNEPRYSAYWKAGNMVYLAFNNGLVSSIDLNSPNPVETPFVILPAQPRGLVVAGDYVVTGEDDRGLCIFRSFNSAGQRIATRVDRDTFDECVWSEAAQKIYYLSSSEDSLVWQKVNANGTAYPGLSAGAFGNDMMRFFNHWQIARSPIRVSPDGSVLVLGSGAVFDANTLQRLPLALPASIDDVAWQDGKIHTIRTENGGSELESWTGPSLAPGGARQLVGKALRLIALDGTRMFAVCLSGDRQLGFYVLNGNLEIIPPASLATPGRLAITTPGAGELLLQWSDVSGELGYVVERRANGSGKWEKLGKTAASETRLRFPMTASDGTFDYRVTAFHGVLVSQPSPVLENVLSGPPLPPKAFKLESINATSASFSWRDGALENGYRIERRSPGGQWLALFFGEEDAESGRIAGLDSITPYEFRIAARNPLGLSDWVYVEGTTGEGHGEIAVYRSPGNVELIDFGPGLDFHSVKADGKHREDIVLTIMNKGKRPLRKVRLELNPSASGDFSVIAPRFTEIGGGKSVKVLLRFTPRGLGQQTGNLQIFSSDASERSFNILCFGEGVQ